VRRVYAVGTLRAVILLAALLTGCEKGMQDMYQQPRYDPLAPSALFQDGGADRLPPPGSEIASRGDFAMSSAGRVGREAAVRWDRDEHVERNPYPITPALLQRGRERYDIYCAPCHGPVGDGDGFIVRRGFPAPPSFHIDRLRDQGDRYFVDAITRGYGVMYPYADRVAPADRWAIAAYVRALQLSQHAPLTALSADERTRLQSTTR